MKKLNGSLALKIVAVAIAVILWLYIQMVENPETEYTFKNVDIDLTNQTALYNKNLSVKNQSDFDIDVTLKCQRWSLTELEKEGFMVYCDLSEIYDTGKVVLPVKVVVNNDKISVVNREPASLTLEIEKIITVEKPIEFHFNGSVKDGYYTNDDMISKEFEMVSVTGPESVVALVNKGVVNVELNNKSASLDADYSIILVDENNDAISSDRVTLLNDKVNVKCEIFKKKIVDIKVKGVNKDLEYEIVPAAVEIAGQKDAIEAFDEIVIENFYLNSAETGYKQNLSIKLPDNVTLVTDVTPQLVVKGFKEGN